MNASDHDLLAGLPELSDEEKHRRTLAGGDLVPGANATHSPCQVGAPTEQVQNPGWLSPVV